MGIFPQSPEKCRHKNSFTLIILIVRFLFYCKEKSTAFCEPKKYPEKRIKLKYALTSKERKILNKKQTEIKCERWSIFSSYRTNFQRHNWMEGREFLCVVARKKCVWDERKRKIANKRRNFIATNCFSRWESFLNDVFMKRLLLNFYFEHHLWIHLYPSENQTPVEWKVLFLSVWLTCVLLCWKWTHFFWQLSFPFTHISRA